MVASLGDSFNEDDREDFANRNIVVGAALKAFSNHVHPPKEKRFIIVGIKGNSVGVIYINTNPNVPPKLLPYLNKLELTGRESYLTWDCYADCNHIYEWGLDQLKKMVCADTSIFLSHLDASDLTSIHQKIKTSCNNDYKTLEKHGII